MVVSGKNAWRAAGGAQAGNSLMKLLYHRPRSMPTQFRVVGQLRRASLALRVGIDANPKRKPGPPQTDPLPKSGCVTSRTPNSRAFAERKARSLDRSWTPGYQRR